MRWGQGKILIWIDGERAFLPEDLPAPAPALQIGLGALGNGTVSYDNVAVARLM